MAKTPEELWASMNAEQQKAFQAKNKDFSVDKLKTPVNQQNASGKFSPIAPKTTTTAPIASSTYNPNVFGDVSGKSTAGQNLSGIKTSTGTTYKAPTEIKYTPLNQNLNYWGTQAEQKLTGNQFAQRNDQVAMNLVSQGKTQDTDIEAFLKSQPGYTTATPEQQENTIRAVKERIGAFSQQPQAEDDPFVESLKRDLGLINLKGEGDISEFIRTAYGNQQTIDKGREKFSNWDETQRKVQGVIDAVARNKMMESQKGMTPTAQLTESDIQAAMQATGATREEIIAISAGKGYDNLQWNEQYKKDNLTKDFDRWVDDSTLEKKRTMDDMTTKLNELKQTVDWQINDIVQKVTENIQGAEKIGALKGFNRSSGYLDGLIAIKDDGNKLINRLNTQLKSAENADEKIRGRLMEDFERNLSRAKFDLDQQLKDLKDKTAVDLGGLQSKYSLGSPQMEVAITGLLDNIYSQKLSAISQYQQLASNAIKTKSDELDLIEKQENQWLNKIKQVETAITAGGGQVLMNMNINDIKGYVSQGMSADVARQMRDAMVNRTIASFSGLSQTDQQNIANMIDKGSTPTEVVAVMRSQGKNYIGGTSGGKLETITYTNANGEEVKTAVMVAEDGSITPVNLPGMQPQQSQVSYNQTDLKETPVDIGVKTVYGTNAKLAPTVGTKLTSAISSLKSQGIDLQLGDTYRSYETQKQAYDSGKEGVVSPDKSFHVKGQAFDVAQSQMNDPKIIKALNDAGFTRPVASEPRHWSYGEGADAFGGETTKDIANLINTDKAYQQANNILNGIGGLPSKNDKSYNKVVNAMGEIADWKIASTDDQNLKDLLNSAKYDKETDATTLKQLTDAKTVLSSLTGLQTNLANMKDDVGPIEGLLRKKNPYDVDAQAVAAQVNALAPKVARGVFGEVGVLTDADIERYLKTIPNQKMTSNVSTIVGDLLKIGVYKSFINTVTTNAQGQRNMSNFIPDYQKAKKFLDSKGISAQAFDVEPGTTQDQGGTRADFDL